jgi:hypothetical protein
MKMDDNFFGIGGSQMGESNMSYRSIGLAIAAFSSMYIANADAQSVYVAPGGVYIGGGPVYVIPAPNTGVPYGTPPVAPSYGYEYGPPAVALPPAFAVTPPVAAPPVVVAPSSYYGPHGGYYDPAISAYGAAPRLRPPASIPHYNNARCTTRYGYDQRRQVCY